MPENPQLKPFISTDGGWCAHDNLDGGRVQKDNIDGGRLTDGGRCCTTSICDKTSIV